MSMCYWTIEGIGLNTDTIYDHIDKEKLAEFLYQQLPNDNDVADVFFNRKFDDLDVGDFLYGEPFDSLGELLTHCDSTDTLTYGDDGDGGSYLYYPPSMPWERLANEPKSIGDVHQRIIQAVQKIVSDLSDSDINAMIQDDLYVVGMG